MPPAAPPPGTASPGLQRAVALLVGSCLALATALGWALSRGGDADRRPADVDAEIKARAVQELVEQSTGIWDAFPDAEVGRVLQPGLADRPSGRIRVSSNRFGVREREWEVPKPAELTRVVLLGDSYVFGNGVEADQRLGAFLEGYLRDRARPGPALPAGARIECLHVGMPDWNVVAEVAFLRRQLDQLDPDLVVHVLIYNDLDDASGTRGFGSFASFSPQHRERADGVLAMRHPYVLGFEGEERSRSLLTAGLDWESRSRYAQAGERIRALASLVEARGGRYLALVNWTWTASVARELMLAELPEEQTTWLPDAFFEDVRYRVSRIDPHWNRDGHELLGRLLYATIASRDLLPDWELSPWPAAEEAARGLLEAGLAESRADPGRAIEGRRVSPVIDFDALDAETAAQVHGGVFPGGRVAPYASMVLRSEGATTLVLEGRCLDRSELDGAGARVFLDEREVGRIALRAGEPVREEIPVPTELASRGCLSLRLVAEDYVYVGPDQRSCAVFRLSRAELR